MGFIDRQWGEKPKTPDLSKLLSDSKIKYLFERYKTMFPISINLM
jgi:hypothetical protein